MATTINTRQEEPSKYKVYVVLVVLVIIAVFTTRDIILRTEGWTAIGLLWPSIIFGAVGMYQLFKQHSLWGVLKWWLAVCIVVLIALPWITLAVLEHIVDPYNKTISGCANVACTQYCAQTCRVEKYDAQKVKATDFGVIESCSGYGDSFHQCSCECGGLPN
jgi:hypothetical protein